MQPTTSSSRFGSPVAAIATDTAPDANLSDANLSDANLPDSNLPDSNLPDSNLPEVTHANGNFASSKKRERLFLNPDDPTEVRIAELLLINAGIGVLIELHEMKRGMSLLSTSAQIDYLKVLQRQASWINAWEQEAIIAVAGISPSAPDDFFDGPDDMEREDIASALRLAPQTAQNRIDIARTLVGHLPQVCSALATGEISSAHATTIAREIADIIEQQVPASTIQKIEEIAIAHAEFHTPSQVTNKVRAAIAKLAPEEYEVQALRARDDRRVEMYPNKYGMATVVAILPAADAQTLMLAIDKLARICMKGDSLKNTGEGNLDSTRNHPERLEQFRADALVQLASTYLATTHNEALNHRRPVTVNLTIDLNTLLGLNENPGILSGYGAIPASAARELASDGKWRRFITDPITGNLLDYGRDTYQPPQVLVDFLMARDRICRFPGCRQPARTADIDHAHPWNEGGETSAENMGLLCRRHHRMKTVGGWNLESFEDGSCRWTSPSGKIYNVASRPIGEVA